MSLTAGIVGLPNVGKSTLFNAITKAGAYAANFPFATIEPNVGVVEVHDERLDKIVEIVKPRSIVPTSFSFTDIAGLVKGASHGEGLGNQFLSHIRDVDAICQVVRCFDSSTIIHVSGKVDPIDDIETVNLELILADLEVVEKRIPKIEKKAMMKVDKESVKEYDILKRLQEGFLNNVPARLIPLTDEEKLFIKNYQFLTMKPMLYVANVSEDDIVTGNAYVEKVREYASHTNSKVVVVSAKIEEELSTLSKEDKEMFLEDLGLKKSGLENLILEAYSLLGLCTFFTAGEKECRAWTFKRGMKAPECAGVIHSDFEKGFIKAETYSYDDLITYGTPQKVKEAGKVRLEGKDYVVQDGDIMLFRFNI
ncbi:MAG: redox-regulated ATPase YchF [Bacilli bacterium]|nr:redox-regulated ATPase YchF [Mollicutes bacterium]MDY3898603.1 redox-regulated ATPase YchF [Bacilli bacterium]